MRFAGQVRLVGRLGEEWDAAGAGRELGDDSLLVELLDEGVDGADVIDVGMGEQNPVDGCSGGRGGGEDVVSRSWPGWRR